MNRKLGIVLVALLPLAGAAACGGGSSSSTTAGGGSTSAFCNEVKAQQASSQSRDSNSSSDPKAAAAALDKLVASAPSDIKKEMQQLQAFDKLASQASTDSTKSAEFESQLSTIDAAITKITTFVKDKCGIDLNAGNSDTNTAASSS